MMADFIHVNSQINLIQDTVKGRGGGRENTPLHFNHMQNLSKSAKLAEPDTKLNT